MASTAKTVVATGASSGLGFEAVKQLLTQTQPYRFILGCRKTKDVQVAYDGLGYDTKKHSVTLLPLELSDLRTVKIFAAQTLDKLESENIDVLMLNAAVIKIANEPGINGSRYNEQYIVNHLSQHYLIHLLREKLVASKSRIVVVSSGAVRVVSDISTLDSMMKAQSGAGVMDLYPATKFTQLLGAHWWRRQLQGYCHVVAVSPGMIPATGLARNVEFELDKDILKDAKSIETEDPDQIFLTSWGEWWPEDSIKLSLDKELQDKWSPLKQQIEHEELVDR